MDANRFDALSKMFAARLSRRSAMRAAGVGVGASMLAAVGLRPVAALQADTSWYTVIRRYTLSGPPDDVLQELNNGYLPLIRDTDGYVSCSVVSSANNTVTTITTFESQGQLESASQQEADWVEQNLSSLLPAPAEETHGDAIIFDVNADLICGPAPTETVVPTDEPTPSPTPCTGIG